MPAPKRNAKLPNYKYIDNGPDKAVTFIDPVKFQGKICGMNHDTKEILTDARGNAIPYKQIALPNWVN